MLIDGEPVHFSSPRDALDRGIATVYQDLATVPLMSIMRNFFMGREPVKGWGPLQRFDKKLANAVTARRDGEDRHRASAIRTRRSGPCPAASGNAWRSPARSISARGC